MNNSQLESKSSVLSTMASGARPDAWHWRNSELSNFSSEKLNSILNLSPQAQSEDDRIALEAVRLELERRSSILKGLKAR
jgi:activator of HSP90 ATPase